MRTCCKVVTDTTTITAMPDELSAEADPRTIDDLLERSNDDLPPEPLDPRAKANLDAYFRQLSRSGSGSVRTAAGAEAAIAPQQLMPPEQRRSLNVSVYPQNLYDEMPDRFNPGSPGGVTRDLRQNAHSPEYVQRAVQDMYEGVQGHSIYSGQHPLLNDPKAGSSPMAAQLGIQALKKMILNGKKDAVLDTRADNEGLHVDYDEALNQALQLQQYPQIPF